ncbi:hypothetical protein [Nocardia sp. SSK8]
MKHPAPQRQSKSRARGDGKARIESRYAADAVSGMARLRFAH